METHETRELVERFKGAWVSNDTAGMAPLLAEDVVWSNMSTRCALTSRMPIILCLKPCSKADNPASYIAYPQH